MKILVISPYIPQENTGGSGLKLLFTLSCLKSIFLDITLITFYSTNRELNYLKDFSIKSNINIKAQRKDIRFSIKNFHYINRFYSNKIKGYICQNQHKYNAVYLDSMFSGLYAKYIKIPCFIDFHNFHSQLLNFYYKKTNNPLKKIFIFLQNLFVSEFERKLLNNSDINKLITGEIPENIKNIKNFFQVIPYNIVEFKNTEKEYNNSILFTGNFNWLPNRFALNIIKDLAFTYTKLDFTVAGKDIPDDLYPDNIYLWNNPASTSVFFNKFKIFLSPVEFGSGINIKILQAIENNMIIIAHINTLKRMPFLKEYIITYSDIKELYHIIENIDYKCENLIDYTELKNKINKNNIEFTKFIKTSLNQNN